jgi:hypothetical protein
MSLFSDLANKVRNAIPAPPPLPPLVVPPVVVLAINIAKGDSPAQAAAKAVQPVKDVGKAVDAAAGVAAKVAAAPHNVLIDLSHDALGDPGKIVAEITTMNARRVIESRAQITKAFAGILQGKNPLENLAIPLAAAIEISANEFRVSAKPLPQQLIDLFKPYYSAEVLQRAKYAIGSVGINLPDVISNSNKFMDQCLHKEGKPWAVTVDDVMVFPQQPSLDTDLPWWAHELQHVAQYASWGVNTFAFRYVTGYQEVENEAINKSADVMAKIQG